MNFSKTLAATLFSVGTTLSALASIDNPQSIKDLLQRIGSPTAPAGIETTVDDTYAGDNGAEKFQISTKNGKPWIKGTTLSAVTTGLGWYLNHTAGVNLCWNFPQTTLTEFPLPTATEEHTTTAAYRYYLNYCTFSYSMSTWTWERWQQEIDWMALRGINMPLQIIGLEEVWRKFLMEDYGYSRDEANAFVGGPCYMAWFGMNNLQGWGGPNPDWWYERQAQLGRKITERMRSLGIEPVLPGWAGMVPDNFTEKTGIAATTQDWWCGFLRPFIVDSTGDRFGEVARKYYARLNEVMGQSKYYSIDPYHEGGAAPANPGLGYQKMNEALHAAKPDAKWVIQSWQWSGAQRTCLSNIPKGELIVLDLYSDGKPNYNSYSGHETVYSTIFNFGGRTGFFGRIQKVIDGYFDARNGSHVKGIGAAPEAIEQTPVMYDLLFELPWMATKPDAAQWISDYADRRYGQANNDARQAWELLRTSALNCQTNLQGPHEAVMCGRPALNINKVSSWGGSDIFYDQQKTAAAAYHLLGSRLSGNNYDYDLTDLVRQAITDYSKTLLSELNTANASGNTDQFNSLKTHFLELMLGVDELLNTHPDFMLGHWTERARAMADEIPGTTAADKDWLEANNARQLITTWGAKNQAESGKLRDYSYRQWGGMVKDFYYERWKTWFDAGMKAPSAGWFQWEWDWAHNQPLKSYPTQATGSTVEVATRLLSTYLPQLKSSVAGQEPYYLPSMTVVDLKGKWFDLCNPETDYAPSVAKGIKEIAIDFSKNGKFEDDEIIAGEKFPIPASAPIGERVCRLTLADGTQVTYTLQIVVDIQEPRTVTVRSENTAMGSASIKGTDAQSITTTDYVVCLATPTSLYDFDHWTDGAGNDLGKDNPLTYYGREDIDLTAHFVINKWGVPPTDGYNDKATMESYKQYVKTMSVTQAGETTLLYETQAVPDQQFHQIPSRIYAAPGGEFTFSWTDAGGLRWLFLSAYCDLNSDGTFEMDRTTELLGTLGTYKSNNNPEVAAGTYTVLLPFSTKKEVTHIRLRFDSSWNNQAYNSDVNCFKPDGYLNRLCYEIILDVNDSPNHPCTVTYKSNDPSAGSMRSENETMVYNPGEEVTITAFPNHGYRVKRWVDNHGRELPRQWVAIDGNGVSFKVYDNAEITAEFEKIPVENNGWTFDWEYIPGSESVKISKVITQGNPDLDLNAPTPVVGSIADSLFIGQPVKTVTLPANGLVKDATITLFETQVKGDCTAGAGTAASKVYDVVPDIVAGNKEAPSYTMLIEGYNNGDAYNQWGSVVWANGTNGLASSYANGWSQFYMKKDGHLVVKWNGAAENIFDQVKLLGNFKILADYDRDAEHVTITVSNASGQSQTKVISNKGTKMKWIAQFCTNLPVGFDYSIRFYKGGMVSQLPGEAFAGCTSLMGFKLPMDCTAYAGLGGTSVNDPSGRIVGVAEGALEVYPFTLSANGKTLGATPIERGGVLTETDIRLADSHGLHNDLWQLHHAAESSSLHHLNSSTYAGTAGLSDAPVASDYSIDYSSSSPEMAVTVGSAAICAEKLALGMPRQSIEIPVPNKIFALTAPHGSLELPESVRAYIVTGISDLGAETEQIYGTITGRQPVIIALDDDAETLTLPIVADTGSKRNAPAANGNILSGTGVDIIAPADYYLLQDDGNFHLQTAGTRIPANSAYILRSDTPGSTPESFAFADSTVAVIFPTVSNSPAPLPAYDLQGRRATKGLVITADGTKIIR